MTISRISLFTGKSQGTVAVWNDRMGPSCIKTGDDMAIFVHSHRKLRFVPVVIRLIHTYDRLHRNSCKSTDTLQIIAHLTLFELQLFS